MRHISHLSSAEARRLWEALIDPPAVHILWENLVELLSDLFDVERTNLFLVIPEKQQLRTRAASRFTWDIVLPWHEGIAGKVYQSKQPSLINDIPGSEFGHYFNRDPKGFRTHSMLTVPVYRDGDEHQPPVAIIQLVNRTDGFFGESELEALKYWARQVGVTLERAHGTEIWRHPESEPPYLNDPEFGPLLPPLTGEQIAQNLTRSVAAATAEWSEYHLQSRKLTRAASLWEHREVLKIVRDECRHVHLVEQLSPQREDQPTRLGLWHRTGVKLFRLLNIFTHSHGLACLLGTYHEWYSFFSSSFLYSLYQGMPRERNVLKTIVEDERNHSTFYESRLLHHMLQKPHTHLQLKIIKKIVQLFYAHTSNHLTEPLVAITQRAGLPKKFAQLFHDFTEHRMTALLERAQLRQSNAQGMLMQIHAWWVAIGTTALMGALSLILLPIALCWRMREPAGTRSETIPTQVPRAA